MRRRDFIVGGSAGVAGGSTWAGQAWARQANSIEVPIRLANGRVLVDVTLNGEGPLPFVIDTGGAVSGMKNGLGDRLRLRPQRYATLNGRRFPVYEVGEVVYGGAIRQPRVALFELNEYTMLGGDGLLAAGTVTAMDAQLEYERGVWSIHPGGMPALDGYERLPSEMKTNNQDLSLRPYADVSVNGRTLRALWDTGAPRPLSVHHEAARSLGLLEPSVPYAPVRFSGIQGMSADAGRMVRAAKITIGSSEYSDILVAINPPSSPRNQDAVLGLPIMQTLDTAFDRSSRTFSVRRNGLTPGEEPHYSRSGIWMDAGRGRVRVAEVGTGSPAAEAGVRPGDVLDGVSDLQAGVRLLAGPDGQTKELRLNRNGQSLIVRFDLKAYL